MIEYYSKENAITAFKAFNKDFTCKSFQYEVGKSYHMDGEIVICKRGFHACKNPLDVFGYYPIFNTKIAIVKLWGIVDMQLDLDKHTIDIYNGKICASDIYIEKEINYFDLISYFIKFTETQRDVFDFLGRVGRLGGLLLLFQFGEGSGLLLLLDLYGGGFGFLGLRRGVVGFAVVPSFPYNAVLGIPSSA